MLHASVGLITKNKFQRRFHCNVINKPWRLIVFSCSQPLKCLFKSPFIHTYVHMKNAQTNRFPWHVAWYWGVLVKFCQVILIHVEWTILIITLHEDPTVHTFINSLNIRVKNKSNISCTENKMHILHPVHCSKSYGFPDIHITHAMYTSN